MKILILADVESKYLWDYFDKSKLEGVDLILSCGDLNPQYLSFLASFTQSPVLYVRGNHDDCHSFCSKFTHQAMNIRFSTYVYTSGRLIQDQNLRIRHDPFSKNYFLLVSTTQ